ncbi:adenylate/guanylate cyclase domain-containing protein [Candidatus Binatia bacterium]|jgi:class 3 adenylate cyclase|nr:adenylate/guanylate cyclase domain-containing protein [Candidatus Binatia bacterium]
MRRRTADLLLLASVLVVWTTCAVLHVRQVVHGRLAWVPVYVAMPARAADHPRVRGYWPGVDAGAAGGLAIGDRLLRVGDEALDGVGPIGFFARVHEVAAASPELVVPVTFERDGALAETHMRLVRATFPWRMLPLACALVVTMALVLLRRGDTPLARASFLGASAFAIHWTFFFGGPRWQTYAWLAVFALASSVMMALVLRAALLFPPEGAPERAPRWPWAFCVFGPLALGWVLGAPIAPEASVRGAFAVNVAFILAFLLVLTRNYRIAGPVGRRQAKWAMLGMYVGLVPVLLADAVIAVDPALWWLHEAAAMAEVAIPVFILIAVVRENMFDVDRLITRAAAWTLLSIALLAAALFAVPHVARFLSVLTGIEPQVMQPVLSFAAAAGIVPGARVLEPRLERVLFRERHALRSGVDGLLRELATARDRGDLLTLACTRLDEIVSPRSCAVYALESADLVPVVVAGSADDEAEPARPSGRAVRERAHDGDAASAHDEAFGDDPVLPRPALLPVLDAAAPLMGALTTRSAPLDVREWLQALRHDASAVETLDAAIVVPIRRNGALAAAVVLGPKRSGDVYTPTDVALLGAVGDKLGGELARLEADVVLREERAMRDAFRRYVPAPVAARLTRGQTIEGGERDVSVLFVDIRGYTTLSEKRTADAVFALVSRYTEVVSAVIQRRGGTVVEFLGDGLMAVFGAPETLADHAGAAVEAACEIASAVRGLSPGAPVGVAREKLDGGGEPLAVGVGVASGRAFVGNVRTNDRLVYTAVGDVVNLAARIEKLTRELGVSVAIDASTHRRAGARREAFVRHADVRVRGRAEAVDVYALTTAAG